MNKILLIGVSPRLIKRQIDNIEYEFIQTNNSYINNLTKIGLNPIILPINNYNEILSLCSGFLITGGDDINPVKYNHENSFSLFDDRIDKIDFDIMEYASKNNIPLLGICRGLQVINVYYKGTLNQDVQGHFMPHIVTYKNRKLFVNSTHHQAILNLGNELIDLFKKDDIIEVVIHKRKPITGIQWHPERLDDISSNFIFKYFKKQVLNYEQINQRNKTI